MRAPLCIDLFCGMFGWSRPWLDLGGYVVGFDINHEPYHGPVPDGADLVLQDVRTLHGSQFKDASLILASSPCPEYSYMAMPWTRAKQIARALRGQDVFPEGYRGSQSVAELNDLFEQPRRIQREACEAAGRYIPLIQENVKGAQAWVGKAAWNFGGFYLWGDVPALMPAIRARAKVPLGGAGWRPVGHPKHVPGLSFNGHAERQTKNSGGSWFNIGSPGVHEATKNSGSGSWFGTYAERKAKWDGNQSLTSSGSSARKAASARIAKIPEPLARHICQTYYP